MPLIILLSVVFHIIIDNNMVDAIRRSDNIVESAFLFERMNKELLTLNQISANLEWRQATNSSGIVSELSERMSSSKASWKRRWCSNTRNLDVGPSEERMIKLLCRGPKYTPYQAKTIAIIFKTLSKNYMSAKVCRLEGHEEKCYNGEPELERLMATSRNESELRWAWTSWRDKMSEAKYLFATSIGIQNLGARNNGYRDIGECWREELEIPNLEDLVDQLYNRIEPLYRLLHAVVRYRLAEVYPGIVDVRRAIPAHLLGNMWSQNWESLIDLLIPDLKWIVNVTEALKRKNYTVTDMVKRAEDFYISLGFPPMTKTFWEKSIFEKDNNTNVYCHGTAANMYKKGDFRILACLELGAKDFYVIHHEMGHVEYYMAYEDQPTIFKNGANSAFHEAVGDAIMYGVLTPQHMQRLGLIDDSMLALDLPFLLAQALGKLPQLPHALIMDKWRWDVFAGKIKDSEYNRAWWKLNKRYMGIVPPTSRSEDFFDPAAKFHIVDNTPYIRYFLGYILQVQLFKGMCEAAVLGKVGNSEFNLPLHRCDIYGSKDAGHKLKSLMKLGSSINWQYAIQMTTGSPNYKVEPLLEYYQPIYKWLELQVNYYNIPVGWD